MATKNTKDAMVSEQPKIVETIEDVENVSAEDLADVDETLRNATPSRADEIKAAALRSQNSKLRTLAEIVEDLSKPLAPRHLKKLTQGPARGATYVPWPVVGKYLDFFAPGWSLTYDIVTDAYGTNVIANLTIPTADFGLVTRSGVGFEPHVTHKGEANEKITGFGGAGPIASRMAAKRAAVEYGLGKYLYTN